jgi:hypothetical protein
MSLKFLRYLNYIFFFAALPITSYGQSTLLLAGSSTWVGIRGGASIAGESFTALPDNSTSTLRIGAIGGLTFEHWFNHTWAISTGVLFDQKGINESYAASAENRPGPNGTIYSGTDDFSMNYIEIPILLKYALGIGTVRPYLCAGPSIGTLLQESETASGTLAPITNLKSSLQTTDLSIYAGLGFMDEIHDGPMILFEAGYAVGISNVFKTTPTRYTTDPTQPPTPFPDPIDPTGAKSGDIRVTIGAMWKL